MKHQTSFEHHRPRSIAEVCSILLESGPRASLLAGGTDLLVRIKRSIRTADVIIDLGALDELHRIVETPEGLLIGAMTSAGTIAEHRLVRRRFPIVSQAASLVGGLQIRNMATLGGALCSGLRCQFLDQSDFWRSTIGRCLHHGGETCHAKPGDRCLATIACDLPPALVASAAKINISGPCGQRWIHAEELYTGVGTQPLLLEPGELVTAVLLEWSHSAPQWVGQYRKARFRRAVDRPLVGLAFAAELSSEGVLEELRMSLCGNGPACSLVPGLDPFLGTHLDQHVAAAIGRHVSRWFEPSPAIRIDRGWRRAMAGVLSRRILQDIERRVCAERQGSSCSKAPVELSEDMR